VRIHNDSAFGSLSEYFCKAHHRDCSARDHVGQDLAGPDRWQLIDVTNDEQGRFVRHCLEKRIHQQYVHHRGLIDNEQIAVERVRVIPSEAAALGIDFEEAG
jgi:hypothetical protein